MNILEAICKISVHSGTLTEYKTPNARNKMNALGTLAELHIQQMFGGDEKFSYLGNDTNPPDIILKNSDAIEVKKFESDSSSIQLNSSYPKKYLYRDDSKITAACKEVDGGNWISKDMLYILVKAQNEQIHNYWFVYGDCYCADRNTYTKVIDRMTESIELLDTVELSETNEIARLNRVDPLGITYLRVRGMWGISHPNVTFSYIDGNLKKYRINCILRKEKYMSFPDSSKQLLSEMVQQGNLSISEIEVKNPDNPAQKLDCYWIYQA